MLIVILPVPAWPVLLSLTMRQDARTRHVCARIEATNRLAAVRRTERRRPAMRIALATALALWLGGCAGMAGYNALMPNQSRTPPTQVDPDDRPGGPTYPKDLQTTPPRD
jgi:hypothetical protein